MSLPGTQLAVGDRVLVTRLDYLGDVILTLPLVDAIRREYPGVTIDYLTRRPAADLLAGDDRFGCVFVQQGGVRDTVRLVRSLRARRYQAVIDLYSNPRSAWLCWLSRAPVRIGGNRRGRRRLYTDAIQVPRSSRAATPFHLYHGRPLGIERPPGKPRLREGAADRVAARDALRAAGIEPDERIIVLHPGGKWSVKRWPSERFGELARRIHDEMGTTVVLLSGPGEQQYAADVARAEPRATSLPVLPIRVVAGVIEQADGLVACDGGIMHLSAALGTPTVGIFGSAEPDVWFPYDAFGPYRAAFIDVPCRPCHRHVCPLSHTNCLNQLSADLVFDRLTDVLSRHDSRGETRAE